LNNILICSAGRRVELVRAFCEQAKQLLVDAEVHAIDCNSNLSSACQVADKAATCPRITEPGYADFLLDYAQTHHIGLIIPTIDTELKLLAEQKERFLAHGIHVVISSLELITACRDKRVTGALFRSLDIEYPELYTQDTLEFPCFVKPYDGSCSVGAQVLQTADALTDAIRMDPSMMFMAYIDKSYDEYTVDAYYSDGDLKCLVPRKRLEVRAGEVSKGLAVKHWLYDFLGGRLLRLPGACGCMTIQVFANEQTQHCIGLEINPRFGGGYPLTYAAGGNYPGWLIREYLRDERIEFYETWEYDLLMLRYDASVLVRYEQAR
jgi:carbamoyl-phosphate synthase large subunit